MLWTLAVPAAALSWVAFLVSRELLAIWIDEQADIARNKRIRRRRAGEGLAQWDAALAIPPKPFAGTPAICSRRPARSSKATDSTPAPFPPSSVASARL